MQDVTDEFFRLVDRHDRERDSLSLSSSLAGSSGGGGGAGAGARPGLGGPRPGPAAKTAALTEQQIEFNRGAQRVNQGIIDVTVLLQQYTYLIKSKGLYNNPKAQIEQLGVTISRELKAIEARRQALQDFVEQSLLRHPASNHEVLNTKGIVKDLASKLSRSTNEFQQMLLLQSKTETELRARTQRFRSSTAPASGDGQQLLQHPTALAHSRRQKQGLQPRPDSVTDSESSDLESGVTSPLTFSALETKSNGHSSTSSSSMPALPNYEMLFATGDGSAGAAADSEAGLGGGAGGGVGVGFADGRRERRHGADGDEDGLGDASSQMLGMLAARPQSDAQEDAYLASRTQAVQNIRSTIEELAVMSRRLNELVLVQEEMATRIDANVSESLIHVEDGHKELLGVLDGLSSNQWLILKVFAVLIVFAVFFVGFIA